MFCRNCGQEINDNAYICVHCGVLINEKKAPKAVKLSAPSEIANNKAYWTGYGSLLAMALEGLFLLVSIFTAYVYVSDNYGYSSYSLYNVYINSGYAPFATIFGSCAAVLGALSFAFGITDYKNGKCKSGTLLFSITVFSLSVFALVIGILAVASL